MTNQNKKPDFANNDGTYEAKYYDSQSYAAEYNNDDDVPEWVKTPEGIESMMRAEQAKYDASRPKRKTNLGTTFNVLDYINQQLKDE